jgi:GT2 family glycosyltransferase
VLVVDNASGDGSAQQLQEAVAARAWGGWVEVLPQDRNGGFSFGNNRGFDRLRDLGEWGQSHVLLLNPDAQVQPGCLPQALAQLGQARPQPRVGIISVPIRNGEGEPDGSAHRWPSPLSELLSQAQLGLLKRWFPQHDVTPRAQFVGPYPFVCDWVSGAFFLIHADLAAQAGDMDEDYFLYFEEVDYCKRAAALGWQVMRLDGPGIVHLEGASTGIGQRARPRPAYWYNSRRRFFCKHYGLGGLLLADLFSLLGRALMAPRRWLGSRAARETPSPPLHYHRLMLAYDLKAVLKGKAAVGGSAAP